MLQSARSHSIDQPPFHFDEIAGPTTYSVSGVIKERVQASRPMRVTTPLQSRKNGPGPEDKANLP